MMGNNGMQDMKILIRNEYRRNTEARTVQKNQQMYFVLNSLIIPKQLIATGGVGSNV